MSTAAVDGYELSPQQRRLWLVLSGQAAGVCRARARIELRGPLDHSAARRAVGLLAERIEILRTRFHRVPELRVPLQVVEPYVDLLFQEPAPARQAQAPAPPGELASVGGELLGDGPVGEQPRAWLETVALDRHLLHLDVPALCADRASLARLTREFGVCYAAVLQGESPTDVDLQYADLAAWYNDLQRSEDGRAGQEFWREFWQVRVAQSELDPRLPGEQAPAPDSIFKPERVERSVSQRTVAGLEALAHTSQASLPTLLLACFRVLLSRRLGTRDVLIGTLFDGRRSGELEAAIGLLAQHLPVPIALDGGLSFGELLRQVTQTLTDVEAWQDYFCWEHAEGGWTNERPGWFGLLFEWVEPCPVERIGGLTMELVDSVVVDDRFKLRLEARRVHDGLRLGFDYDPRRLASSDVERLADAFVELLEQVVARPADTLATFDCLGPAERHQLLVGLNGNQCEVPTGSLIHELFEAQAARTPHATALVFEGSRLSYGELNARANRLAYYLREHGVGTETLVALCMDRSLAMVVGLLGVLKAGGAYVPLDPSYPREWLELVLADAGAPVLLTQAHLTERLPPYTGTVVCLDDDWPTIATRPAANLGLPGRADQSAYLIYTSGSTGRPKGVVVEHRSPINLLVGLERMVYADAPERPLRVTLNAPLSFDASMQQLVLLLRGHELHIIPAVVRTDGRRFLQLLRDKQLDALDCTPTQLRMLVMAGLLQECAPPAVFRVLVAGESIDGQLWGELAATGEIAFYNIYGPTECTVDATACRVTPQADGPTIGRPLPNYEVYVVDEHLRPMPIGVPGELVIGGAGLARGYHRQPALTAERFVPSPFGHQPGERLYRTGDRALVRPDGSLEFWGRLDNQVKIRGHRVELGEIESILSQHSVVRQVAVVAREDRPGDIQLAAYLVAQPGQSAVTPSPDELREFVRRKLPTPMLPRAFVWLERLPVLASGKIDRQALAAMPWDAPRRSIPLAALRSETERQIGALWQELLGVERVGRDDNFFDLGGHSLLVVQLHSLLCQRLGAELALVDLFNYTTVGSLGEFLAAQGQHAPLDEGEERATTRRSLTPRRRQRAATRQQLVRQVR